jgi:DNA-binding XRE family transcriptional regulator
MGESALEGGVMSKQEPWTAEEKAEIVDNFGLWQITDLTKAEVMLAKAVGLLGDPRRVELSFDLAAGSVDELMDRPDFVALVDRFAAKAGRDELPDIDFGRALDEKKRQVARLMVDDHLSQTEAAQAAHVTTRTIRNWEEGDPFYNAYVKHLIELKEASEQQTSREENAKVEAGRREAKRLAVLNVLDAVRNGNVDLSAKIFLQGGSAG